jgi:hypothetical protein
MFCLIRAGWRINDSKGVLRLNHCCAKSVSGRPSPTFSTQSVQLADPDRDAQQQVRCGESGRNPLGLLQIQPVFATDFVTERAEIVR